MVSTSGLFCSARLSVSPGVGLQIDEEDSLVGLPELGGALGTDVLPRAEMELPLPLAEDAAVAEAPVEILVRGGGRGLFEDVDDRLSVELVAVGDLDPAELGQGGEPVAADHELVADLTLGDGSGERDDRGNAQPALEEVALVPAIGPGRSAAAEGPLLDGVAVVGLEDDEGVPALARLLEVRQELAREVIDRGDEGGVLVAGGGGDPGSARATSRSPAWGSGAS